MYRERERERLAHVQGHVRGAGSHESHPGGHRRQRDGGDYIT